jgi:alanyl-tRNA synthetase
LSRYCRSGSAVYRMVRSPLYLACVGYFHVLTSEHFFAYIMTWTQDHPACAKAIFSGAGFPDTTSEHDVGVILDSTSFYAEQGGHISNQF